MFEHYKDCMSDLTYVMRLIQPFDELTESVNFMHFKVKNKTTLRNFEENSENS